MMAWLFGNRRAATPAETNEKARLAILKLNTAIDNTSRRIEFDDKQMAVYAAKARAELRANRRDRALAYLKDKRRYEIDQKRYIVYSGTLLEQKLLIEGATLDDTILEALRTANEALRSTANPKKLKEAEDLMASLGDQVADADAISGEIARPVGTVVIDDDELNRELDAMIAEDMRAAVTAPPSGAATPVMLPPGGSSNLVAQVAAALPAARLVVAAAAPVPSDSLGGLSTAAVAGEPTPAVATVTSLRTEPAPSVIQALHRRTLSDGDLSAAPPVPTHLVVAAKEPPATAPRRTAIDFA